MDFYYYGFCNVCNRLRADVGIITSILLCAFLYISTVIENRENDQCEVTQSEWLNVIIRNKVITKVVFTIVLRSLTILNIHNTIDIMAL